MYSKPIQRLSNFVGDLSHINQPMGALFTVSKYNQTLWNQYRLNTAQLTKYKRNGFTPNLPTLNYEQVSSLLSDYQSIINAVNHCSDAQERVSQLDTDIVGLLYEYHSNESNNANQVLFHCLGQWRCMQSFHDLIFHPSITIPVAQLLALDTKGIMVTRVNDIHRLSPIRFCYDQLFAKPAQLGSNVAWHQDYSFVGAHHITAHIALDTECPQNGAIAFIPQSQQWHRKGRNGEKKPLPLSNHYCTSMNSIEDVLNDEEHDLWEREGTYVSHLESGQSVIHHCMCMHGSFPNRTDMPRRAAVLNYFVDGTIIDSDEQLLGTTHKGDDFEGRFHPLVFDPQWFE